VDLAADAALHLRHQVEYLGHAQKIVVPAIERFQRGHDRTGARPQAAADRQALAEPHPQRPDIHATCSQGFLVGPAAGDDDVLFGIGGQVIGKRAIYLQAPVRAGIPAGSRCDLHQVTQQGAVERCQGQAQGVETDRQVADRSRRVDRQ
jgi:hypothetical protein